MRLVALIAQALVATLVVSWVQIPISSAQIGPTSEQESRRPLRRGGTSVTVVCGVATGFLLYFLSDVVSALGVSARIPVALAAWSPAVVCCLLGTAMLFHLEDG